MAPPCSRVLGESSTQRDILHTIWSCFPYHQSFYSTKLAITLSENNVYPFALLPFGFTYTDTSNQQHYLSKPCVMSDSTSFAPLSLPEDLSPHQPPKDRRKTTALPTRGRHPFFNCFIKHYVGDTAVDYDRIGIVYQYDETFLVVFELDDGIRGRKVRCKPFHMTQIGRDLLVEWAKLPLFRIGEHGVGMSQPARYIWACNPVMREVRRRCTIFAQQGEVSRTMNAFTEHQHHPAIQNGLAVFVESFYSQREMAERNDAKREQRRIDPKEQIRLSSFKYRQWKKQEIEVVQQRIHELEAENNMLKSELQYWQNRYSTDIAYVSNHCYPIDPSVQASGMVGPSFLDSAPGSQLPLTDGSRTSYWSALG